MSFTYLGKGAHYKERRTDSHVYFVGGPFSQWWKSDFNARPWPSLGEMTFSSCEKYMMAGKALLFHDVESFDAIMESNDPKEIKLLGRGVKNFDQDLWECAAREIVFRGNLAKFSQNEQLREYLIGTEKRMMVEGAVYDRVWGVKLAWDDPAIEDETNWKGTNWLGQCLMRTRDVINARS